MRSNRKAAQPTIDISSVPGILPNLAKAWQNLSLRVTKGLCNSTLIKIFRVETAVIYTDPRTSVTLYLMLMYRRFGGLSVCLLPAPLRDRRQKDRPRQHTSHGGEGQAHLLRNETLIVQHVPFVTCYLYASPYSVRQPCPTWGPLSHVGLQGLPEISINGLCSSCILEHCRCK